MSHMARFPSSSRQPFVSATASQSTVAQGDPVYITGTAQGQPSLGVQIWILGKNFAMITTEVREHRLLVLV